jgi:hypothetical protein
VKRPATKKKKKELVVDPYIFWRISNMTVAARFIESGGNRGGAII